MNFLIDFINEYFGDKKNTTLILGLSVAAVYLAYYTKSYIDRINYFKRMNIPGPTPLPIVGNTCGLIKRGLTENHTYLIKTYGKVCGYFQVSTPVILTTDVKFIKSVLIKDFSSFVNRRIFDAFRIEPMDKFLTVIQDEEWKNVRSLVTTTFTSGKLKSMTKCINGCLKNYEKYLQDLVQKDGIIATKTFFRKYTLDVISSCCFGMDVNSINDPDNDMLKSLQLLFASFSGFKLMSLSPGIFGFLTKYKLMEIFPRKSFRYLEETVNAIIGRRKSKIDSRDDFIQYMVEHEDNKSGENDTGAYGGDNKKAWNKPLKKTLTNKEILAQSVLFLSAGYDTTATTLEFVAYNLATHPSAQEKLIEEIDSVLEQHNGEISYDSIANMKYMDMVIDETLRMYPPGVQIDRVASNDYEYEGIKMKKGQIVVVPIYTLHHDPDIYPNPDEFDPERFSDENKKLRDNITFMPFGAGPRNCVGMRFALVEIKLLLSTILSKYRFATCDKTPKKIVIERSGFMKPIYPIFLQIQKRN